MMLKNRRNAAFCSSSCVSDIISESNLKKKWKRNFSLIQRSVVQSFSIVLYVVPYRNWLVSSQVVKWVKRSSFMKPKLRLTLVLYKWKRGTPMWHKLYCRDLETNKRTFLKRVYSELDILHYSGVLVILQHGYLAGCSLSYRFLLIWKKIGGARYLAGCSLTYRFCVLDLITSLLIDTICD